MKKLLALLLAILTMVSVVGCGQAASNPADDDPAAIRDNINLVLDQAVEGLNPWKSTSIVDRQLAYQLYEPLYYRNTEGVYEPKLAESYTLSEDGRTYTFKIRQGVKFHNGQELTAEDVAWSIEYGFVSGPYAGARGKLSNVESAYVVDEETVNIVCKDTDSSFFGNLMIYGLILCKDEFLKAEEAGTVGVEFVPIQGKHSRFEITGFRIGELAYLTDFKTIEEGELQKLQGVELLVVNALRWEAHDSHFSVEEALQIIDKVGSAKAFLTHMSHEIGLHAEAEERLPEGVYLAYDGLSIDIK